MSDDPASLCGTLATLRSKSRRGARTKLVMARVSGIPQHQALLDAHFAGMTDK